MDGKLAFHGRRADARVGGAGGLVGRGSAREPDGWHVDQNWGPARDRIICTQLGG